MLASLFGDFSLNIILFILMQIDGFVAILFILKLSG